MRNVQRAIDGSELAVRAVPFLLPAALTLYFAFSSGGYFPGATAMAAGLVLLALGFAAVVARRAAPGWRAGIAIGALPLLAFGIWTYMSSDWSGSPGRAAIEADRIVLYLACLLTLGAFGYTAARARALVTGMLLAIAAICALAVASRLLPSLLDVDPGRQAGRLAYPVSYWNALGLISGIGCVLALHASASLDEPLWRRALATAAMPVVASALLLSLSRSAVWSTALGVVVYILVGRPRGLPAAAIALIPTTGIALLGLDHGAVVGTSPDIVRSLDLGGQPAWILGAAMVFGALLRLALSPLDRGLAAIELTHTQRRALLGAIPVVLVIAGGIGIFAAHSAGLGRESYDRFVAGVDPADQQAAGRLTSISNNNRISKWRAAMDEFRAAPAHGSGAGTFQLVWLQRRPTDGNVQDAHSLYVEVLGELGLPGLLMLVATLLAILGALLWRARGPGRAAPAALFAAGVTWAVSAGLDWDWELPIVTAWLFGAGGLALSARHAHVSISAKGSAAKRVLVLAGCVVLMVMPVRVALSASHLHDARTAIVAGNCATGAAESQRAASALDARWEPWQLLGYCALRERRWDDAEAAFIKAAERDRRNYGPYYGVAVAQAQLRQDPTAALAVARRLNPRNKALLEPGTPRKLVARQLRAAARLAAVPLP